MTQEDAEKFEEDIGMRIGAESIAKAALRAHQQAAGMTFDDPDAPVAAPFGARDEEFR